MKKIITIIAAAMLILSSQTYSQGFTIKGKISGIDEGKVTLQARGGSKYATGIENGKFTLKGKVREDAKRQKESIEEAGWRDEVVKELIGKDDREAWPAGRAGHGAAGKTKSATTGRWSEATAVSSALRPDAARSSSLMSGVHSTNPFASSITLSE